MAKKHHRASKKQTKLNFPKGTFIPNKQKSKLITLFCIISGLIFIKGMLLGYLLNQKN